jgi:ankyrin repeat protein
MWASGHDEGVGAAPVARVVDLLIAHGAGLDDADNRGRTALMITAELGDAGVVDLLLQRGADRARKDKEGKTALDLATKPDVRELLAAK